MEYCSTTTYTPLLHDLKSKLIKIYSQPWRSSQLWQLLKLWQTTTASCSGDPTQLSGRDIDQPVIPSGQTWSIVQCKCINSEFWHICTMFHNKMLWRQCNVSGLPKRYLGPHMDWTVLQLTQWCVSAVWWIWPFLLLVLIDTKGTRQPPWVRD